jgi:3-hydroxyacyl-CoA dehydrogenase
MTETDAGPRRAAVIGAGTMGGGIAMAYAGAGIPVTLIERERAALDRGLEVIRANWQASVRRGRLDAEEAERRFARIAGSLDLGASAEADIVTEAAFEDMAVKLELFRTLDRIAPPTTLLASNTSTLDVDAMADATARPERVLGMHYFSPAHVMRLVEVVRSRATAPAAVARAVAIAERLGKLPVVVGVCFGFVGNRMLFKRAEQAELAMLRGSTPAENDAALVEFGFPMGHHAMMDLAGLDVEWRIRAPRGEARPVSDRLYEMGRWGQKRGAGYYRYEPGDRTPRPDPAVEALIRETAVRLGLPQRAFTRQQLLERQLYPMVNEGARILEEGIADSAADIDVIWVNGFGWPAALGGPMRWADGVGLPRLCNTLDRLAEEDGDPSLRPAALLRDLAARGAALAEARASR